MGRLHLRLALALASTALLSACKATYELPLKSEQIELRVSTGQLVCHVRKIAADQGLSFHYGTDVQPQGTLATFRLIDDEFEIVLVAERRFSYILDIYDTSPNGSARTRAASAYATFKQALLEPPSGECAS